MRVLVAGWFSFDQMGTTAGDIIARDLICDWLNEASIGYDVAVTKQYDTVKGVHWKTVNPVTYTDVVFVCGPFGNGWPLTEFLSFFSQARLTGVNLSLMEPLDVWNPFTLLYARDSSVICNPDITFYATPPKVPVVGIILAHKQKEYGDRSLHNIANSVIQSFLGKIEASVVQIDTALEDNAAGLKTFGEVEAVISKMDAVITTRLHGTVLALKNCVPVVPIDPILGGAKITHQVKSIGWPVLLNADTVNVELLSNAFKYCLTETAKQKANECTQKAKATIEHNRKDMISKLLKFQEAELYG